MSNKFKSNPDKRVNQSMRDYLITKELSSRKARWAYYAFHEHSMICGDYISFENCTHADVHRLHASQLVSTPVARHDKLYAKQAAAILLDKVGHA